MFVLDLILFDCFEYCMLMWPFDITLILFYLCCFLCCFTLLGFVFLIIRRVARNVGLLYLFLLDWLFVAVGFGCLLPSLFWLLSGLFDCGMRVMIWMWGFGVLILCWVVWLMGLIAFGFDDLILTLNAGLWLISYCGLLNVGLLILGVCLEVANCCICWLMLLVLFWLAVWVCFDLPRMISLFYSFFWFLCIITLTSLVWYC